MKLVFGQQVVDWAAQRIRNAVFPDGTQGIGLEEEGRIVCGVTYFLMSPRDMQVSMAAETPRWCTRGNLRAFFHYPFEQQNCVRVTAITAKANKRTRKMLEGLGFTLEGVHPKAMPDGVQTALSYGMLKENCRWLAPRGK